MPRRARCVLPGVPYHVTQRGVDRQATFSLDEDRHTYLRLLRENLSEADVRVWGWCLMSNHVHLIPLPGREDSLSLLMRRVHGRYAQYYNTAGAEPVTCGRTAFLVAFWESSIFGRHWHTWSGIRSEPALSIPPPSISGQAPLPILRV